jgi:hypothetical protein
VPPRPPRLAPWEVSLAEAQQRIGQAEAAAAAAGATAASTARETIEVRWGHDRSPNALGLLLLCMPGVDGVCQ